MSNILNYAKEELRRLRGDNPEPCEMQDAIEKDILQIVEIFSEQGHSGFSAAYAIGIIEKVLRFEPLTPLTGDDDEWVDLGYSFDMAAQNKRCGHVFRRSDGTCYDIDAIIFRTPDWSCYTSSASRKDITFPYSPTREYVDVEAAA